VAETLSRKQLYALVWSEPLKTLSVRFGISDVALKKSCKRAAIPDRPPAMDDEVLIAGGNNQYWYGRTSEELLGPLPPPPEFDIPLDAVRERVAKIIGKVTVPREGRVWHPAIQRLLKENEARREKNVELSYVWEKPLFDSPLESRRLRLLNSLFLAIGKLDGVARPEKDARKSSISFYKQHLIVSLVPVPSTQTHQRNASFPSRDNRNSRLILSILESWSSDKQGMAWEDEDRSNLDSGEMS
jgi:hypothetical protein